MDQDIQQDRRNADTAAEEAVAASANARRWGGGTSRRRQLEQDLAHVNREIYSKNLELAQTNKTLALLRAIDNLVLSSKQELHWLCAQLSRKVVQTMEFPFVAIMGYPLQTKEYMEMYGWATIDHVTPQDSMFLSRLHLKASAAWSDQADIFSCLKLDEKTDNVIAPLTDLKPQEVAYLRNALQLSSACVIRLRVQQRQLGIMIVGFEKIQEELTEAERDLFVRLGEAVGIAVDHKLLFEENQRSLAMLEESNRRLRILDQTKDDFISMASHQLRTPLTSVKGYVSMVLDGDAGTINEMQRKLLNQSFVSAQRMVYLISDLLNVSRLRTGKFVIEPLPCNLANVVGEEIDQLIETAKGRGLHIVYNKPANFSTYPLDENKLRQVIMNFVDNSIYYTPDGGHIVVDLVDKPQAIELTVSDDGIGVPKEEQPHLFTKFFRAHNARRARPDGTGLGLFMAKKVILAHGGAVIFKSVEGQGSIFGFTLPKVALQPAASQPRQRMSEFGPDTKGKPGFMY